MEIKTDRYTKVILTVIAVTLVLLLFKPQVQQSLTPPSAHALTMTDENGNPVIVSNTYIRNPAKDPVPVKQTDKIEVYWEKPMPVYLVDTKKENK